MNYYNEQECSDATNAAEHAINENQRLLSLHKRDH